MITQILLVVFGVILGAIVTQYIDAKKNKAKPKLWYDSNSPIRLQWGWSKRDSCFYCFAIIHIWYQNRSALGKTIKRVRLKRSTHNQEVQFSVSLHGGMPSIEPNSSPVKLTVDINCRSTVKKREQLPIGKGDMLLNVEGADGAVDEFQLQYEFVVPEDIKGPDDLKFYGEK